MLTMYVMNQPRRWEDYLPLVEFAKNNGYNHSINKSPFEALYEWKCNSSFNWDNLEVPLTQ
jgi:hypothetical protein